MGWWNDLEWGVKGVTVKETGAYVSFDRSLISDLMAWLPYAVVERLRNINPSSKIKVFAEPARPRFCYLISVTLARLGVKYVKTADQAELLLYFSDKTYNEPPQHAGHNNKPALNYNCRDISKSHVQTIFAEVFGYDLGVDPQKFSGKMVAKTEHNGAHTGKIVQGPCEAEPDYVYQRVIDNSSEHGVTDIRCPTIFGEIDMIYLKSRPIEQRFANLNTHVTIAKASDHLSKSELKNIKRFCDRMALDWGGLDILRDKENGKIYIVDVNKTDMGPPLALSLFDKLRSTTLLANSLKKALMIKNDSTVAGEG